MSGPALRQVNAHHSIHDAAQRQAEEMTVVLLQALQNQDTSTATEVAYTLIEHWETHTLRHAESEEEGLYKEAVHSVPELELTVLALTRDHQLMRLLLNDIKALLGRKGPGPAVLVRFQTLLILCDIHSREEEHRLIPVVESLPRQAERTGSP